MPARRDQHRSRRLRLVKPRTENMNRLPKRELEAGRVHLQLVPNDVQRPTTRGDCIGGERPCPWVSCRHHLYLDVMQSVGQPSIKLNFPDVEPDALEELEHTCSLDVADAGGAQREIVGDTMNITRDCIRQIETKAMRRVGARAGVLVEFVEDEGAARERVALFRDDLRHGRFTTTIPDRGKNSVGHGPALPLEVAEDEPEEEQFGTTLRAWSPEVLVKGADIEPVVDLENKDGTLSLGGLTNRMRGDRATFHTAARMYALYEQRMLEHGWIMKRTQSAESKARAAKVATDPKHIARLAAAQERFAVAKDNIEKEKQMGSHDDRVLEAVRRGNHEPAQIFTAVGLARREYVSRVTGPLVRAGKLVAVGVTNARRYYLPDQAIPSEVTASRPPAQKTPSKLAAAKKRIADGARAEQAEFERKAEDKRITVRPVLAPAALTSVNPMPTFRVEVLGAIVECPTAASVFELLTLARDAAQ